MAEEREIDWEALLHHIIDPLVNHPEAIMIRVDNAHSDNGINLLIVSENSDTARLVGKKGAIANALRDVVGIATKARGTNEHVHLKFESFEDED